MARYRKGAKRRRRPSAHRLPTRSYREVSFATIRCKSSRHNHSRPGIPDNRIAASRAAALDTDPPRKLPDRLQPSSRTFGPDPARLVSHTGSHHHGARPPLNYNGDHETARQSAREAGYTGRAGAFIMFCRRSDCTHPVPMTGPDGDFSLEYRRVVEMGGIEPPSDGGATGLLRVQFAHDFLSPGVSREQGRRRAQSPRCSGIPDDEGSQQWLPG